MSAADIPCVSQIAGDPTELRRLRGLIIAAISPIRPEGTDNRYRVPSQKGKGHYLVHIDRKKGPEWQCSCADFEARKLPCKHVFAVQFTLERETKPDGTTAVAQTLTVKQREAKAPQTVAFRATYKQNWTAYNAAQRSEKHRFQILLSDLCKGLPEPARPHDGTKGGRPPVPLADRVFASAFKIYSTVSGRRFSCDMADAAAKGHVTLAPHYNSIVRFLESDELTPVLGKLVRESALPLASVETDFAIDSSGFSSSKFVRWFDKKYGVVKEEHDWVKVHLMCGVKTNIVTAIQVGRQYSPDCPEFVPMVEATARKFTINEVSADAAFCSYDNFNAVTAAGGRPFIAFRSNASGKSGGTYGKMFHFYNFNRDEYLSHYHKRSNVESTFSMIKAKFGDAVRSKSPTAMVNEALCKVLCHNLCCLIQSTHELGVEATFWRPENEPEAIRAVESVNEWVAAMAWI